MYEGEGNIQEPFQIQAIINLLIILKIAQWIALRKTLLSLHHVFSIRKSQSTVNQCYLGTEPIKQRFKWITFLYITKCSFVQHSKNHGNSRSLTIFQSSNARNSEAHSKKHPLRLPEPSSPFQQMKTSSSAAAAQVSSRLLGDASTTDETPATANVGK